MSKLGVSPKAANNFEIHGARKTQVYASTSQWLSCHSFGQHARRCLRHQVKIQRIYLTKDTRCTWFGWNSAPQTNFSTLDWWMYLGGIGNRLTIAFAPQTTAKPTSTTPLHQSDLVPGPGMSSPSPLSGGLSSTIQTKGKTREEQAPLGLRWLEHYARSNATGSGLLRLGTDWLPFPTKEKAGGTQFTKPNTSWS